MRKPTKLQQLKADFDLYAPLFNLPKKVRLTLIRDTTNYGWCIWVSDRPDVVHVQISYMAFEEGIQTETLLHELVHAEQAKAGRDLNHDARFIRRIRQISRLTGYKELL